MSLFVDIEKRLGEFRLKVQFEAGDEIFALLGASGCGKSMTLKCIAGIERPDRGRIVLDGRTLFDSKRKIDLPPQERRTGYLFQQYALFPNMTVRQNIRCGIRKDTVSKEAAEKIVDDILHAMHLDGLEMQRPSQLSGGQQQRTALARILAGEPDIVMLDEPFSALDSHLRFRLEREVSATMRRFGKTVLLISHDRDEVFRMADRIAIMENGILQACGDKHEVFMAPETVSGARLTGCKNIAPALVKDKYHLSVPSWGLDLVSEQDCTGASHAGIRLHDVHMSSVPGQPNVFHCRVTEELENPFTFTVMLQTPGGTETFGMEVNKARWLAERSNELDVYIPSSGVLPLTESTGGNHDQNNSL